MLIISFSLLVQFFLIVSIMSKRRKDSLAYQTLSGVFEVMYCLLIDAFTAGFIGVLSIIRSVLFANSKKIDKKTYRKLLAIFCLVVIVNCFITWSGPISLLPTFGTLFRTYALWQPKMSINRFSGITTAVTYGAYYAFYGGWIMVAGYVLLLGFSVYAMSKYDFGKKRSRRRRTSNVYSKDIA